MTLVLESRALIDKAMELAQQLDLHRLAAYASLAHVPELPMASGAPVLAVARDERGSVGIAAPAANEAVPGAEWGRGAEAALVHGPAPELPVLQSLASERLVVLSSGNARLIRCGEKLDGQATAFGLAFWKLLATEAPLTMAAIKTHKIRTVTYTDRYLLTPLALRLLVEVIRALPGVKSAKLKVSDLPPRTIPLFKLDSMSREGLIWS